MYGYFASDIGRQFFPQSSPGAQHLLAFAVFAIGFGARPIDTAAVSLWKKLGFEIVGTLPKAFRHSERGLVDVDVMYRFLDGVELESPRG